MPATKTPQEAADDQQAREDQSSANWWMVRLTGLLALVGIIQAIVFWLQAKRLKETIVKMEEISTTQTRDMRASITEATRAATAMEGVVVTLQESTLAVQSSLVITKNMADTQRFVFELANRAWLMVTFDSMGPQDNPRGLPFTAHVTVVNRGNTPAYDVSFLAAADVLPFPIAPDFRFPLSPEPGSRISVIGPGLSKRLSVAAPNMYTDVDVGQIRGGVGRRLVIWGSITYTDAFKKERFVKFSYSHFRMDDGNWFSQDTGLFSESD